jgi:RimJ/RimL family protein N-acetyltransferase
MKWDGHPGAFIALETLNHAIMSQPPVPTLETARLSLRKLAESDAAQVARLAGHREIAHTTISIPHPYSEPQALEWIRKMNGQMSNPGDIVFAATLRGNSELIGTVGLRAINSEHSHAEMGFWIGVPYWRQGFATEAAAAVLRYAFENLRLNRVFAHHMVRNPASGRVLQKIGMKPEGRLQQHIRKWGLFEDVVVLAILDEEWKQLAAGAAASTHAAG